MKTLLTFFLTILFVNACKPDTSGTKDNKDDSNTPLVDCRSDIQPPENNDLMLSLSLNKCFKNVNQTIFVESTDNKKDTNFFALGAKISYGNFNNGTYKNVRFKDFAFKKLTGQDFYISKVSKNAKWNDDLNQYEINVLLSDTNNRLGNKKCKIPTLTSKDKIEIQVEFEGIMQIGPRICTNYIGSLPK